MIRLSCRFPLGTVDRIRYRGKTYRVASGPVLNSKTEHLKILGIEVKPTVYTMLTVLLQGKTSFIRSVIGKQYPGEHIGVEPTTDRFVAVMHGNQDRIIPGNAAAVNSELPFRYVLCFGSRYLPTLSTNFFCCFGSIFFFGQKGPRPVWPSIFVQIPGNVCTNWGWRPSNKK